MSIIEENKQPIIYLLKHLDKIISKCDYAKIDRVNDLLNIRKKLNDIEFGNEKDYFHVAGIIGTYEHYFAECVKIFESIDLINITTPASQTHMIELISYIKNFESSVKMNSNAPYNIQFYNESVAKLKKKSPAEIEKSYFDNPYSHKLYAAWLQFAYEKHDYNTISSMVERAKDNAFKNNDVIEPYSTSSFPAQRFGLIPTIQNSTLAQICAEQFSVKKCKDILQMAKIANAKSIGLFTMSLVTPNPVQYNIRNLINEKCVKRLTSKPEEGVSCKQIEQFKINQFFDCGGDLWFNSQRYCNKKCQTFLIIRTINGTTWDAFDIVDSSVVDKIERGPSPRIHAIQKINNSIFAKHIGRPIDFSYDVKNDNKIIIRDLITRITNSLIGYIDKSLAPLPTSKILLEQAIRDPEFVIIMNSEILKSFHESGIDINDDNFAELIGTFISYINGTIMVQFERSLKMNMIERGPKNILFKEYDGDSLQSKLYAVFVDIIKFSVESVLLSKNNIYENIIIKFNVLNAIKNNYI